LVSTTDLGVAYFYDGDLEIAKKYFEEVHPLFAKTHGVAFINSLLGAIARIQEQPAVAKSLLEEAVRFLREAGDNQRTVMALVFLGRLELDQANWVAAERCFSEALFLARKASAACFVSWSLESFAYLFMALNQAYRAVSFLGAAEASRERLGTPILPIERREYESSLAAAHAQLDEATFAKAWAEGRALAIEQAIELALQGTN
jgi:tetratricopeptide (TPR) repeat protein